MKTNLRIKSAQNNFTPPPAHERELLGRGRATTCGILYIVATPIGNLADISLRALDTLKQVDLIAAEDTRRTKRLLSHYGIQKPLISLHEYNEERRSRIILERVREGSGVALVSDAGTPLISDPGYKLIRVLRAANVQIVPVPGACAAITALCASGLPTDKFVFAGFLPAKQAARVRCLQDMASEAATLIFYVSPHRVIDVVSDMAAVFGDQREVVLARELTKQFETIWSGCFAALLNLFQFDLNQQKGEFVLLVRGAEKKQAEVDENAVKVLRILARELPTAQAVKLTAEITGVSKNKLYPFQFKMRDYNKEQ